MTIPQPLIGSVIRFGFLWRNQFDGGRDEAIKDRPAAIIAAAFEAATGKKKVVVLPLTTRSPDDPSVAIEVPTRVLRKLGLGPSRCWIVCDEANRFTWPGTDIRAIALGEVRKWDYGMLPEGLLTKAIQLFAKIARARKIALVDRD